MSGNKRILFIATGALIISIVLMIAVIPGILLDKKPGANPIGATIAISLALVFRLIILIAYRKLIREIGRSNRKRKTEYLGIAGLLMLLALIYLDGAFAFWGHKDIFYVSIFMFASVFFEMAAAFLTILVFFLKQVKHN